MRLADPEIDVPAFRAILLEFDPAAIVDLDTAGVALRLSAEVHGAELLSLLLAAGLEGHPGDLARVPSVCCGGCGGQGLRNIVAHYRNHPIKRFHLWS